MNFLIFDKFSFFGKGVFNYLEQTFDNQKSTLLDVSADLSKFLSKKEKNYIIIGFFSPESLFFKFLQTIKNTKNKGDKVIVFTENYDSDFIFKVIKYDVAAIIERDAAEENLKNAVEIISKDEEYFSDKISNIILKNYVKNVKKGEEISEKKPRNLTRREIQILKLVCEGLTNQQIADGLYISVRTVDAHKNHIMQKLKLKTTADLIKFAIKNGYAEL